MKKRVKQISGKIKANGNQLMDTWSGSESLTKRTRRLLGVWKPVYRAETPERLWTQSRSEEGITNRDSVCIM